MNKNNITKEQIDEQIKELVRLYFLIYGSDILKIEIDAKREPENIKIKTIDYR